MSGQKNGEDESVWSGRTTCLRWTGVRWRIVHEHSSVPFYMDGSERAATDLHP